MRDALADPALLADAMPGDTWSAWRTLLIAIAGEELRSDVERHAFQSLAGRVHEPGVPVDTFLAVVGRRGGKTRAMAVLVVYLAALCDWSDNLSLGERGVALFLAPSERQAAIVFRYAAAIIEHSILLSSLVEGRTDITLALRRGIDLEVQAASWRRSRGFTAIAIVLDECAYFHGDDATNSDAELMVALRPSLATTGGPMLLTSSPAAMEGVVYRLHKRHFGPQGDPQTLVVQADSRALNPSLSERVVARAYEDDPEAAQSEYGGSFRTPMSAYLERALVERAMAGGGAASTPNPGISYSAFVDVAGGNGEDSFALAIGHRERHDGREIAVVDLVFEQRPPFDPDVVTARCGTILSQWGISSVKGDRYAAAWPVSAFARHGITYWHATLDASALYLHALPAFTAGRVRMPDLHRLADQLCGLRRHIASGGRETVQHPRGAHDDLANAVAGLLWMLTPVEPTMRFVEPILITRSGTGPHLSRGSNEWQPSFRDFDHPGYLH